MNKELSPLKAFGNIINHLDLDVLLGGDYRHYKRDVKIVEDSLKSEEENSKLFDIIGEKQVDIHDLLISENAKHYNCLTHHLGYKGNLTQEEFIKLKEKIYGRK